MWLEVSDLALSLDSSIRLYRDAAAVCIDVVSSVTPVAFTLQAQSRGVTCTKNLINRFDDFGQFWAYDTVNTNNPLSKFATYIDSCQLSAVTSVWYLRDY